MPLEEYRRKRHFGKTPEPAGEARAADGEALSFVVQKHAARQLHYDLRIELDGVLLSWAVPKGPSLDPADKRLAVHVEDHPLDYGGFEGVIPKGEYGGGTVMVWDRGTWEPDHGDPREHLAEGHLKFCLHGEKLRGKWMLVRTKYPRTGTSDQWLLFKERDGEARPRAEYDVAAERPESVLTGRSVDEIARDVDAVWRSAEAEAGGAGNEPAPVARAEADPSSAPGAVRGPLPDRVEPELATLVTAVPHDEGWLHEVKFDGYRIAARLSDGKAGLWSRNGKDWTDRFGEVARAVESLPADAALLDGEVVALRPDGTTDFQALQNAVRQGGGVTLTYFAFDLLHLDGWDLRRVPLEERKVLLRALVPNVGPVHFTDHFVGHGEPFFARACEYALEGVVSKRRDSVYRPGRGHDWVKTKCVQRQEFVVVGYTAPGGSRKGFGALALGVRDDGRLVYVGRVGSGFTDASLRELTARLEKLRTDEPPVTPPPGPEGRGVTWVRPELVAEVEYIERTSDGSLRHPSFKGLREDKSPEEAVEERPQPAPKPERKKRRAEESDKPAAKRDPAAKPTRGRGKKGEPVEVAGQRITNPERVMWPDAGFTKLDLARYYETIARWAVPQMADRPLSLVRCPEGYTGECFYQKHLGDTFPKAVRKVPVWEEESKELDEYGWVRDLAGVLGLAQMGVLEVHTWGSRADDPERPDRITIDLDPDEDLPWTDVTATAMLVRNELERLGITSFVKTTGGKGIHVVFPFRRSKGFGWPETLAFSHAFVDSVVAISPERFTANMSKAKRSGRIFIDYLRNARGATAVAAYSSRARPGAPVSIPLTWKELAAQKERPEFTIANVPGRVAALKADPWEGYAAAARQSVTKSARGKLGL